MNMLLKAQKGLKSIYWTNTDGFTAESYTLQLLTHFNTIKEHGEPMMEDMKNRYFHQSCYRKTGSLHTVTWIELFKAIFLNIWIHGPFMRP